MEIPSTQLYTSFFFFFFFFIRPAFISIYTTLKLFYQPISNRHERWSIFDIVVIEVLSFPNSNGSLRNSIVCFFVSLCFHRLSEKKLL